MRKQTKLYAIQMSERLNDLPWLKIVTLDQVEPNNLKLLHGVFKTRKGPTELIRKLADEFKLCQKVIGLEKGKGKCFAHQIDKCSGVCVGKEKHELHHLRLKNALIAFKLKAWPYAGKVGIKELNPDTKKTEIHIFEHWCYLETVNDDLDLEDSINTKYELKFDLDIYKLLSKSLLKNDVIQLKHSQQDESFYMTT